MQGKAVVAGVGESTYYKRGEAPNTEFELACTAIQNAVADAGLDLAEVDGFASYMDQRNDPLRLAQALGTKELRWAAIQRRMRSCISLVEAEELVDAVETERAKRSNRSTSPFTPPARVITPIIATSATTKPMISMRKVSNSSFDR